MWPEWLGKLRLCVRCCSIGWERWCSCLLGWAWKRFLHSGGLLLNKSRADAMVMEELKEIQLGVLQLWTEEKNKPLYTGVS